DPDSLGNNIVWSVFEDNSGMLWIGTDGGLDRFDPGTEKFVHYRHDPDDPNSISHNSVRSIFKDATGTLWVGTMGGLNRFNPETGKVTRYQHDSDNPDSLINNVVYMVYEDQGGALWVGTWGGGLDRFDRETETFIHYKENPADLFSISASSVFLMYEDQSGMVWIATEDGGINTLDPGAKPFRHYRAIPGTPNSLNENGVRSLFVDKAGIVWVGTTGGGLNRFDPQTEEFTQYRYDPDDPNSLSNDSVFAIHEDHEGVLWIGGFGSGLNGFDKNTETFTHYKYDPNDPHSLSNNSIIAIHEDQSGILWIGTWGGGVNAFDREKEQFTRYEPDPEDSASLSQSQVHAILEDQRGVIWIGTLGGLNRFDRETGTFTRYQHDPNDPNSIGANAVSTLYEDQSGNFWVGGAKGLDLFNRENEQFTHYTVHDGLPSDIVWGILEDEEGILWLSTTNGLSRFEPHTETFRNYYVSDGLQSDSFLEASDKNQSGELFFGGTNGFNAFNPNQITDNPFVPNVQITDFQLANKPVPVSSDSLLKKSILETDHLVLSNLERIFSFEFAALNYRSPEKNRYKYKMEGFEEDWNEVDSTRRFATYTNLDPGDYIFRVIASNNDGIWNEEGASINITVTPPWWETTWFRIGRVVLVIGLLTVGYRRRTKSFEARTRELETQVEARTQELKTAKEFADEARVAAEVANRAKSTFLANMSHELRTPLNAILGFSRMLARDPGTSAHQNEMLDVINRSGEHLLGMVDDVLSLARIEAGRVELDQETFVLTQMLADIGQIFKSRVEGKGLRFNLDLDEQLPPYLQGDSGKLRQVLTNLLENAVKYTQEGEIWLRAEAQPIPQDPTRVVLQLEVEDTGLGIPSDQLESVFEAFVQSEETPKGEEGTGLGLTIARSLVEIMGGEMAVESERGECT
ncbi:MAG: two-component regulator propeller domain-containing protein, partial [Anaerolineales bacterium]